MRADDAAHRSLYGDSGGHPAGLPGGVLHPDYAAVHDASGPGRGGPDRGEGPGHRREPGAGGQPDHGRAGRVRRGVLPPCAPAGHRHGQDGDHRHCPEDRHL